MNIIRFSENDRQAFWTEQIRACDWGAAKFLCKLIDEGQMESVLGEGELFILTDDDRLVSFATLTKIDCIRDDTLYPWIGFVFTEPEYRGHRYSGRVIEYACREAKSKGYERVYLATDHVGFYEHYGFEFMEERVDIYGGNSRIYYRTLDR